MDAVSSVAARTRALLPRRSLHPAFLAALGAVLAVAVFELWITPSNPPGFLPDEASMSYNAYLLGHHLRDENGALLPLFLSSFSDYKSPVFVYTLAAVFRVTGPHSEVARGLAAVGILTAVLLLGVVARRRTGSNVVAVAVVVLGGLTPWLFEVGRAAYEVALEPLVICLFLLAVESAWRRRSWTLRGGAAVGLALSAIAFVYAAGRLLAPLYALALLVFAGRGRWRWLGAAWGTFAATAVLPIAVYWQRHPGALTERYSQTTFIDGSMSPWIVAGRAAWNYLRDMNLWYWVTSGDPKPYVHTWGAGSLFGSVVLLAIAGALLALARKRFDRFWRFVLLLVLLAPIPAAVTKDRFYGLRLVPLPFLLVALAIPALVALAQAVRHSRLARVVALALAAAVGLQLAQFVDNFTARGWARTVAFHSGVPGLLQRGFQGGRTIYVNHGEPHALVYAKWYAVEHGIPLSRVNRIPEGAVPVAGSVVLGRFQGCAYVCDRFAVADDYWLAYARGPLGGDRAPKPGSLKQTLSVAPRSGLRIDFLGQGHTVTAGSAWAYYLRVSRRGRPWRGTILVEVRTAAGRTIDRVGQFALDGGWLAGYLWSSSDSGQRLEFQVELLENGRTVGSVSYPVYVRPVYVR